MENGRLATSLSILSASTPHLPPSSSHTPASASKMAALESSTVGRRVLPKTPKTPRPVSTYSPLVQDPVRPRTAVGALEKPPLLSGSAMGQRSGGGGAAGNGENRDERITAERLRKEVEILKKELCLSKEKAENLQQREKILQERLSDQANNLLKTGGTKFEDLGLGEFRPSQLIKRYSNLYADARVEAVETLDQLPEMAKSEELKAKLLLSIIVLAFRSTQRTLMDMRTTLNDILHTPSTMQSNSSSMRQAAKDLQNAIGHYLRITVQRHDLSQNYEEVCRRLWVTLYDYPRLKNCRGLLSYIEECVQLSWVLHIQNPPLVIDHEATTFDENKHVRFHSSNPESKVIKSVLWPVLLEGEQGPCLAKGVVIT